MSPPRTVRSVRVVVVAKKTIGACWRLRSRRRVYETKSGEQNRRRASQLFFLPSPPRTTRRLLRRRFFFPRVVVFLRRCKIRPSTRQSARFHPVFPRFLVVHVHSARPRARQRFIPHQSPEYDHLIECPARRIVVPRHVHAP